MRLRMLAKASATSPLVDVVKMILATCGYASAWAVASARRTDHHGLLVKSALMPTVNVPCPVSQEVCAKHSLSLAVCSSVSGIDATASVSATTGGSWEAGMSSKMTRLMAVCSWSAGTSAAVISFSSLTGAELELELLAVVLEQAASSATTAPTAVTAANR